MLYRSRCASGGFECKENERTGFGAGSSATNCLKAARSRRSAGIKKEDCYTTNERGCSEVVFFRALSRLLEEINRFSRNVRWLAILQRYIAAYARHGLQASAWCSSSRELPSAMARKSPKSLEGNASGSPSARIATYCAVHFPMPGISHNRSKKASESITPSKRIRPSRTARARARMVSALAPVNPCQNSSPACQPGQSRP
jgi:hypothetical protein